MLIGIFGQKNNGKGDLANLLAEELGWEQKAFADGVKNVFCEVFQCDLNFIEKWKRNPEPPPGFKKPVRHGLQFIGEGFRELKEDVWLERTLKEPYKLLNDGRYTNEMQGIKERGGLNILIWRPEFESDDPHRSESEIKPYLEYFKLQSKGIFLFDCLSIDPSLIDYFLINDGTLEDLKNEVKDTLLPFIKEKLKI